MEKGTQREEALILTSMIHCPGHRCWFGLAYSFRNAHIPCPLSPCPLPGRRLMSTIASNPIRSPLGGLPSFDPALVSVQLTRLLTESGLRCLWIAGRWGSSRLSAGCLRLLPGALRPGGRDRRVLRHGRERQCSHLLPAAGLRPAIPLRPPLEVSSPRPPLTLSALRRYLVP